MTIFIPELERLAGNPVENWTKDEVEIVGTYYSRGVSAANLAKYLSSQGWKRTTSAVEHLIRRKGMQRVGTNVEA